MTLSEALVAKRAHDGTSAVKFFAYSTVLPYNIAITTMLLAVAEHATVDTISLPCISGNLGSQSCRLRNLSAYVSSDSASIVLSMTSAFVSATRLVCLNRQGPLLRKPVYHHPRMMPFGTSATASHQPTPEPSCFSQLALLSLAPLLLPLLPLAIPFQRVSMPLHLMGMLISPPLG